MAGEDDCWLWTGCVISPAKPYGRIKWNGKRQRLATHVSWELATGSPPSSPCVLHKCDNPRCVNPRHLFEGDNDDNVADRVAKGRTVSPRGTRSAHAKLTDEQVLEIRVRCASGEKLQSVADSFGVSEAAISHIRRRRSWTHLGGPASRRASVTKAGDRFGRLVAVAELDPIVYPGRSSKVRVWLVRCDCGNEKTTRMENLRFGSTRSCGCLKSEILRERNRRAS